MRKIDKRDLREDIVRTCDITSYDKITHLNEHYIVGRVDYIMNLHIRITFNITMNIIQECST